MIKFFKIIEKIVWALTVIMIAVVLIIIVIAQFRNIENLWFTMKPFVPCLYAIVAIILAFKSTIVGIQLYQKVQVDEKASQLQLIINQLMSQYNVHDRNITEALTKLNNNVEVIPKTDTSADISYIKSNLPQDIASILGLRMQEVASKERQSLEISLNSTLTANLESISDDISALKEQNGQKVLELIDRLAEEKAEIIVQQRMIEIEKKEAELKNLSFTVQSVVDLRERLLNLQASINQNEENIRKHRMKNTEEYTMLVFSLAKTPVEDVEKVCQATKLFIESGHVVADKQFKIAHNKKLRNAELWHFAKNIVKYNQKENLDVESYLMITFEDWFKGSKDNFARNYSDLPKNSLVSKDGVEADLERLRNEI